MQNNLKGLQNDISQHFETMLNKVNSLKEEMTELEESGKKVNIMLFRVSVAGQHFHDIKMYCGW